MRELGIPDLAAAQAQIVNDVGLHVTGLLEIYGRDGVDIRRLAEEAVDRASRLLSRRVEWILPARTMLDAEIDMDDDMFGPTSFLRLAIVSVVAQELQNLERSVELASREQAEAGAGEDQ